MRWTSIIAAVLSLTIGGDILGQSSGKTAYGLFGPRSLGGTLQPKSRTRLNGLLTGPAGDFVGRGRANGLTFNPSVWQSAGTQQAQGEWRQRVREGQLSAMGVPSPGTAEGRQAAFPSQAISQPAAQGANRPTTAPAEEMWFRSPPGGTARTSVLSQPGSSGSGAQPGPLATATGVPRFPQASLEIGFVPGSNPRGPGPFLTALLGGTPQIARMSPISVTMENDTAVLRGRVRTQRDRQLAEDIVRLEPGVWQVRNELEIAGP